MEQIELITPFGDTVELHRNRKFKVKHLGDWHLKHSETVYDACCYIATWIKDEHVMERVFYDG